MGQSELFEGVVRHVHEQTPHLRSVVLEVTAEVAAQYERPGQVVAFVPGDGDDKPLYVALASSPGEARGFEVLLGPAASARLDLTEGATWRFQGPFGAGYPIDEARGKDVLLFAVGSALAPLRPVVEVLRRDRASFGKIILWMGAHTDADFPYAADLEAWSQEGIDVRRSISKPWVQDVFRSAPVDLANAFAFVCGMPAMMEGVTEALTEAGLPADSIGKNW